MIKFIIAVALILIAVNIVAYSYWCEFTEWLKRRIK
jgi:hypothetical protein